MSQMRGISARNEKIAGNSSVRQSVKIWEHLLEMEEVMVEKDMNQCFDVSLYVVYTIITNSSKLALAVVSKAQQTSICPIRVSPVIQSACFMPDAKKIG